MRLKYKGSKILFIQVEVQSYGSGHEVFGERMFRYFYRIWDKFRYKYEDKSEIVAAAIYTYKGERGKDKNYIYKLLKDNAEEVKWILLFTNYYNVCHINDTKKDYYNIIVNDLIFN